MSEPSNLCNESAAMSRARGAGDRALVEQLLGQHRDYLRRVAQARMDGRLAQRVDASDVVQEAQMEAFRRIDDFLRDPQVPLKIWLRQLLIDRILMEQRKHLGAARRAVARECRNDGASFDAGALLLAGGASPSRMASERETHERVLSLLDSLQEKDREILMMHFVEGLSGPESAAALGIEPATARQRLGRAIRRLRQAVNEQGLSASSI
jgi:RNA polymerase sigma-70 factor (ECF subfamily)